MSTLDYLSLFSALSFIYFGISCLLSPFMKNEFIRYGLAKHRRIVGILQFLGGVSLLIGVFYTDLLALIASLGLAAMMIMGYGVRLKIKDPFLASFPALFYAVFNSYLAYCWWVLVV